MLRITKVALIAATALLWVTSSALAQTGTATFTGNPGGGITLTIGATQYVYHSSGSCTGAVNCVVTGGSTAASAANMTAAINNNPAQCSTTQNATIAAGTGGATESGTTVTITTTAAHWLGVGENVIVTGVGVAGYNGTWTVASVPTSTTFTYTAAGSGLANSGGGSANSCFFTSLAGNYTANASVMATVASSVITVTNITSGAVTWSTTGAITLNPAASIPAATSLQVKTFPNSSNVSVTSASTTGSMTLDLTSLGSSSNNRLLVGVSVVGLTTTTPIVSSIKWGGSGGTALTQVCSVQESASTSNWVEMEIWGLQNPSAISSTVVITLSGSTVFQAGAVVFTNVASLGTCATQFHKGGDAVSSTSVTVTAPGAGGAVFDTLAVNSIVSIANLTMTPTAGQANLWNVVDSSNPPGDINCLSGGCSAGGAGSWAGNVSTMSYSFPGPSQSNTAYGAVPLIAAAAPSNKRKGQTIIGALQPPEGVGFRLRKRPER